MRLSDVLSKPVDLKFWQVDGFLDNRKLKSGKSKKLAVGKVGLPYFCKCCDSDMTFISAEDIYCIGVNNKQISIDSVLTCSRCGNELLVWFLVESNTDIHNPAPEVRVLKRTEKFTPNALSAKSTYGNFAELLGKADCAYRNELGAGAIIYLRKAYETITLQTASAAGITIMKSNGTSQRPFKDILQEVDAQKHIIPQEFSADGYKLFGELSEIAHGTNVSEADALLKYEPLHRLVVGIIENVKNNAELMTALGNLGWQQVV